jgi:uncharacterized protein
MANKTKKITYKSLDDIRLSGVLHLPEKSERGSIILAHGINSDKDESGSFVKVAEELSSKGFKVLRFDFRAQGESSGKSRDMTITGEFLDMVASIRYIRSLNPIQHVGILAASFGAGIAIVFASVYQTVPSSLVLWNPVLDYEKTFLNPKLGWAKEYFNEIGYRNLNSRGFLMLEDFQIGTTLVDEMRAIKPYRLMQQISCPVLTLHGDKDSKVPFEISEKYAMCNKSNEFIVLKGAEHAFLRPQDREIAVSRSVDWFSNHVTK